MALLSGTSATYLTAMYAEHHLNMCMMATTSCACASQYHTGTHVTACYSGLVDMASCDFQRFPLQHSNRSLRKKQILTSFSQPATGMLMYGNNKVLNTCVVCQSPDNCGRRQRPKGMLGLPVCLRAYVVIHHTILNAMIGWHMQQPN